MHVTSISAAESGARKYLLREPVKEAWAELRVAPNLERKNSAIAGLTEMCENSREGMRQPSNMAYPLHGVKVLTNTVVHRVSFSSTTATGVELADSRKITARKEVIICASAYRTPQVLMLSSIGPSATLAEHGIPIVHESTQVGRNLHDYFAIYLAFRLRDPSLGYALGSSAWQDPAYSKVFRGTGSLVSLYQQRSSQSMNAMSRSRSETCGRSLPSMFHPAYREFLLTALTSPPRQCFFVPPPVVRYRFEPMIRTNLHASSQTIFPHR